MNKNRYDDHRRCEDAMEDQSTSRCSELSIVFEYESIEGNDFLRRYSLLHYMQIDQHYKLSTTEWSDLRDKPFDEVNVTAIMLPNAESAIAIFIARLPPNTFKFKVTVNPMYTA